MLTLTTALLILILDQLTKLIITNILQLHQSLPIVEGIFHLTYVRNHGAAFGILPHQRIFFILITLVLMAVLIFFYNRVKEQGLLINISLGLIFGGAVGNLIDRVRWGYVIDFFDFRIWPVFNIADSAIVIGVGLFFYWAFVLEEVEW
ncbi:signal peptidase II [Fuchsiella alkaliacetigena]|uniref:signal peptidase II n=1 Tax=Fuchsiella alkaliacetigena TaxID=957042 RepID=UPI00200A5CAB|nr:signal peptidase II [Fuchsiella alkaliacetigena]MCK8825329.1 signal peptidase II [Fuchsiella alkaliacetigena]